MLAASSSAISTRGRSIAISGPATTKGGSASATTPSSSALGRRAETGCGVAPSFQQAKQASMKPTLLGSAMVTKLPCSTPLAASARASRLVRRSSSPQLRRSSPQLTAASFARAAASSPSRAPRQITSSFMAVQLPFTLAGKPSPDWRERVASVSEPGEGGRCAAVQSPRGRSTHPHPPVATATAPPLPPSGRGAGV